MNALVPRPSAGGLSMLDGLGPALQRLSELTGDELTGAVRDLPKFSRLLDTLTDEDQRWQIEFRRQVVNALDRLPEDESGCVPRKLGLMVLHSCIVADGPERALEVLDRAEEADSPAPTWTDLVRLYRPKFASGNPAWALEVAAEARRKAHNPGGYAKPRAVPTPYGLRLELRELRHDLARLEALVARCDAEQHPDLEPIPPVWLVDSYKGDS